MVFSVLGVPVEGEPSVWFATCWQRAGIYFKMETVLAFLPFPVDWEVEIKRRSRVCLYGETGKGEAWLEHDRELRTLWGGLGGWAVSTGCFQQTSQVLQGVKPYWFGLLCHYHYLKFLPLRHHLSWLRYKGYPLFMAEQTPSYSNATFTLSIFLDNQVGSIIYLLSIVRLSLWCADLGVLS